jgi:glyoxylase-like metal-dependent hydrolase (beta-lactamase superfamily II)
MYSVKSFEVAFVEGAPGPEFFWMSEWGNTFPLSFQMLLIRGNGKNIIINTGPTLELVPVINDAWGKILGEKCLIQPKIHPVDALSSEGLKPEQIDFVIVTPFQHYAMGNVDKFKNAHICLSKKGWIDFMAPEYGDSPFEVKDWCIPPRILNYLMFEGWEKLRLLEDEDEILPGLSVFWSGGHHRSSMTVKIKSNSGTVCASDSYFVLENVEKNIPIGITESVFECFDAYKRVRKEADIIIPLYDKNNFVRHKDGIISE